MNFSYAYTPQIWFPALTALLIIALAVYTFRRRSVPGALLFTFALLFGALWMIGTSLEIAAVQALAAVHHPISVLGKSLSAICEAPARMGRKATVG